jgi:hypothetical protein
MSDEKPKFRPLRLLTEEQANIEMASGDPERIRLALIDGSRCLPGEWCIPHAVALAEHSNPSVRWAAMFALDFARSAWMKDADQFFEILDMVALRVAEDPESDVRHMGVQVLTDVIGKLYPA